MNNDLRDNETSDLIDSLRPRLREYLELSGIVINQYNTFENIADPGTILPMLEANNRQLKSEIFDGMDRGSF